jgi:hypothetical protein
MNGLLIYLLIGLAVDIIFIVAIRILNSVLQTNVLKEFIWQTSEGAVPCMVIFLPIIYPLVLLLGFYIIFALLITKIITSEKVVNFCNKILKIKE